MLRTVGSGATDSADLAVIVVSANSGHWLKPCLSSVTERADGLILDVIVVDSGSNDGTRALVETEFPAARVVTIENRGFAAGDNAGLAIARAPFVLFLNPDTELVAGSLRALVGTLSERTTVGLVGVRRSGPTVASSSRNGDSRPSAERFSSRSGLSGTLSGPRGSVNESWTRLATTANACATGRRARSCSPGARRSTPRASSMSGSSFTPRSPTSASG